jgi:hypothetical protein
MERVYRKMAETGFFVYPDEFTSPEGGGAMMVTPYAGYFFWVQHGGEVKELTWEDSIMNESAAADRLRDLIDLILRIIESKEEYKALPPATGGYM